MQGLLWCCVAVLFCACCAEQAQFGLDGSQLPQRVREYAESEHTIFVAIAAFMDPELLPTVTQLLERAMFPNKLEFGILIQEDKPVPFPFENEPNFNVRRVHYLQSRGVGWARHTGKQLFGNQTYLLQLDSHHRFVQNWDAMLIEDFWKCIDNGSPKPILTTYLPGFTPGTDYYERDAIPRKVVCERYYDSGKVRFVSSPAREAVGRSSPHPAAVISAHFIFTWGFWLHEVPYDPLIYFDGEEDTLSARSWTHGYDIFYPHRNLIYHQYGREGQKKHWDIHPEWWKIKRESEARVRQILGQEPAPNPDFGEFGMGTERSYEEFQKFSGLYFPKWYLGKRAVQGDVEIRDTTPPPAKSAEGSRCMLVFEDGQLFEMGGGKWEERKNDDVRGFTRVDKGKTIKNLMLFDKDRSLHIKRDSHELFWGSGHKPEAVAHWVKLGTISREECIE